MLIYWTVFQVCILQLEAFDWDWNTFLYFQFSVAAATLDKSAEGAPNVWVCASDKFSGQVAVINVNGEPTIESTTSIGNAAIVAICSVPAPRFFFLKHLTDRLVIIDEIKHFVCLSFFPSFSYISYIHRLLRSSLSFRKKRKLAKLVNSSERNLPGLELDRFVLRTRCKIFKF